MPGKWPHQAGPAVGRPRAGGSMEAGWQARHS